LLLVIRSTRPTRAGQADCDDRRTGKDPMKRTFSL
jgi:hypothetical protein